MRVYVNAWTTCSWLWYLQAPGFTHVPALYCIEWLKEVLVFLGFVVGFFGHCLTVYFLICTSKAGVWNDDVRNGDVRRLTKQPKLTAIIQLHRLTLFGHIMPMDDNADAKRFLLASPLADWRRQLRRPRITWLSTVQQDLKQHHITLPEAADLAQNRPLWRMMSTYGATQSWVACQKRPAKQLEVTTAPTRMLTATVSHLTRVILLSNCWTMYKWTWYVWTSIG